jgi:hypothetical protein
MEFLLILKYSQSYRQAAGDIRINRIFKLTEITTRVLRWKGENRKDEPIQVIMHIYGTVIMKTHCIAIFNKQKCLFQKRRTGR